MVKLLKGGDLAKNNAASLPNIRFGFGLQYPTENEYILNGEVDGNQTHYGSAIRSFGNVSAVIFDASTANAIYQDKCNTVQPPAIILIPQIKF